jgi:hypothetical protein
VPVVNSTYLHLYMGNNHLATGGPQTEERLLSALAEERGVGVEVLRRELAGMPQPARYRSLAADYLNSVRTRPADTLQHRFEATVCFLMGQAWLEERRVAEVTEASEGAEDPMPDWLRTTYTSTLLGTLLFMYGLGFLGWRWTYVWRNEAKPSALALVWIPLPYILGHADWLSGPRLPLDGVLLTYAAFALCCFLPGGSELYQGPPADETPGRR